VADEDLRFKAISFLLDYELMLADFKNMGIIPLYSKELPIVQFCLNRISGNKKFSNDIREDAARYGSELALIVESNQFRCLDDLKDDIIIS
jgi:hypothetical protein